VIWFPRLLQICEKNAPNRNYVVYLYGDAASSSPKLVMMMKAALVFYRGLFVTILIADKMVCTFPDFEY
jgi:hypothetical protein